MKRLPGKHAIYTPGSETTVLINYQEKKQVLEVEFTGGRVYHYFHVPKSVWKEYQEVIRSGGSSGTYVNQEIKLNFTDYKEVQGGS